MLDGVFNHSGFVSRYFNGDGSYPSETPGAAESEESPYYRWYHFSHWPDRYDSWWGIYSLPAVNESESCYRRYIIGGEDSIVKRWLRAGADGWRLDVADELPDAFIHALHTAARSVKSDAVVIGEVWEDGSNKIAYGVRRRHILGGHCDGLMNYPFRNAAGRLPAGRGRLLLPAGHGEPAGELPALRLPFGHELPGYPRHPPHPHSTGGGVGTAGTRQGPGGRSSASRRRVRPWERPGSNWGPCCCIAFPGSPTLYYGDEAGMEGFEDPFNRRTYPWGREDGELRAWYTALGCIRGWSKALRRGSIVYERAEGSVLAFRRTWEGESVLAAANAGGTEAALPIRGPMKDLMTGEIFPTPGARRMEVSLPPCTGRLLVPLRYRH